MGARQKLNQAHFNAALLIGGALGLATGSFGVFVVATGAIIAIDVISGGIRTSTRR